MADWASASIEPGEKVYLFVGPAGVALDILVAQAIGDTPVLHHLYPPLTADMLSRSSVEERHVTIIRSVEELSDSEWLLLDDLLAVPKIKGQSVILVGSAIPSGGSAAVVRARVQRQGKLVDVSTPTGVAGRQGLVEWVQREFVVPLTLARSICERVDYSVADLVWARKVWLAVTGGSQLALTPASKLANLVVPQSDIDRAYRALLERSPITLSQMSPRDTLYLLRRLESALSDLDLLSPVMVRGASAKVCANRTGLHIVRVMELTPIVSRYPPAALGKCRKALMFGLTHYQEPEAASLVAMMWR